MKCIKQLRYLFLHFLQNNYKIYTFQFSMAGYKILKRYVKLVMIKSDTGRDFLAKQILHFFFYKSNDTCHNQDLLLMD